jgi:hypothetical protein
MKSLPEQAKDKTMLMAQATRVKHFRARLPTGLNQPSHGYAQVDSQMGGSAEVGETGINAVKSRLCKQDEKLPCMTGSGIEAIISRGATQVMDKTLPPPNYSPEKINNLPRSQGCQDCHGCTDQF